MAYTVITSDDSIPIEVNFKVSAGPGAGKTFVITQRVVRLLDDGVDPYQKGH